MATRLPLDLDAFEINWRRLSREIADCSTDGRAKILPVTKYLDADDCDRLRASGYGPFGENRADELVQKAGENPVPTDWHFIGHLQRNKISKVVPRVSLLQSLDNERLASDLHRWLETHSHDPFDCLVQINVAGEASKGGLPLAQAPTQIARWVEEYPRLRLRGLMTMAPQAEAEACRPVFRALRVLRDAVASLLPRDCGAQFTELSMGMSNDYRIAAEEGATLIRLGRVLYERPASRAPDATPVHRRSDLPKLLIENGADRGKSYIIRKDGPFFAGRDKAAQVVLVDEMASRRHFQIEHRESRFFIRDLESSNGTFLNGSLVRNVEPLAPNDRIQVGSTLITFQTDAPHPLIGREVSGYRILDRIGRGGMGTVYRALQTSLDRVVALKVLAPHLVKNTNFVNLFIREARSAGALSHPNIVQVYDVGVQEDTYFFSMEYIPDGSVEDLLNRQGPIPLARALRLVHDAAQGLQYAEQVGIIHRDIKPGNLMIGTGGVVKIGDLGISRSTEGEGQASQKDGVSGSPHYIAPEQARGFDIDGRVDIYSLGCSFYQMLSGSTPFRGSTPREVILKHLKEDPKPVADRVEALPNDVAKLVHYMMAKNPADRVQGAGELIRLLEPLLRKYPDESASEVTHHHRHLSLGKILALVITVLVLIGVGGGAMYLKVQNDQRLERETQRQADAKAAIEGLWMLVSATDVSGFEAKIATLTREQFTDEEWAQVEQASQQNEQNAAARARAARLADAKRALGGLITRGQQRLEESKDSAWEPRVAVLNELATELRDFVESYQDLETEGVLAEATSRAAGLEREATSVREHELEALEEFDRLRPRAEGFSGAGNFIAARRELGKFDTERYANTSAHRAQQEAVRTLRGAEERAWEQRARAVAGQVDRKEYAAALLRLESFGRSVAFDETRAKVDARIASIEELRDAGGNSGDTGADRARARAGIETAWRAWASKLDLTSREIGDLRDLRVGLDHESRSQIEAQADLLERWKHVMASLDGRELSRATLGLPSGDRPVQDLQIDGEKIRYTSVGGNPDFSRWGELSNVGRVRLLTELASSSEEKLFAGLLGLILGNATPESTAAWLAALEDKNLGTALATARALADLLDE